MTVHYDYKIIIMQSCSEVSATGAVIGALRAATVLTRASNGSSPDCADSTYAPLCQEQNRRSDLKRLRPGRRREIEAAIWRSRPDPASFRRVNLPLSPGNAAASPRSVAAMACVLGTIFARSGLAGANTPRYGIRCARGLGISAANRAVQTSGSRILCLVPSQYGVFNA